MFFPERWVNTTEHIPFIAKDYRRLGRLKALRELIMSKPAMISLVLISCLVTFFSTKTNQPETVGLFIFVGVIIFNLLVCDELISTTLPFLLLSCFMIKRFDSFNIYIQYIWLAPIAAAALVAHFWLYRKTLKIGSSFFGLLAVSFAVTLGGLGSITKEEYFSVTSLYYVFGLGFGMVFCYVILYSYFENSNKRDIHRTFAYIMYLLGIFACAMILLHYVSNYEKLLKTHAILEPQWRNNLSTFIMLAMPFGFYLSIKEPRCMIASLLTMPCLVLTSSRGGLVLGGVEFLLCCIYIVYCDKKHRNRNLLTFFACACVLILLSGDIITFISKTLARFEVSALSSDPRAGFIQRAVEDFKSNPLFGKGIGYMGNMDIFPAKKFAANWYHSYPFQIIGSFGVVGIFAYLYQFIIRSRIFWRRITFFTLAVYISYIGILMMSLVNPGEFCPIPYEFTVVMMFAIIEHRSPVNRERILIDKKH